MAALHQDCGAGSDSGVLEFGVAVLSLVEVKLLLSIQTLLDFVCHLLIYYGASETANAEAGHCPLHAGPSRF